MGRYLGVMFDNHPNSFASAKELPHRCDDCVTRRIDEIERLGLRARELIDMMTGGYKTKRRKMNDRSWWGGGRLS